MGLEVLEDVAVDADVLAALATFSARLYYCFGRFFLPDTTGGSTVNRGHEHHRLIRCCSAREGRPRRFGGTQRDSGT